MIKGDESHVKNIDFELRAKRGLKILMFYIVFEFKELFISLQPDVRLRWGVWIKNNILMKQVIYIEKSKLNIADM